MKRLTQRIKNSDKVIMPYCLLEETCDGMGASKKCNDCEHTKRMLEKLADYEDAEEQGLLLGLQLKAGDVIWDNDFGKPCSYTITGYSFGTSEGCIDIPIKEDTVAYYYKNSSGSITGSFVSDVIGKTVFLTKEEAEAKLKECTNETN